MSDLVIKKVENPLQRRQFLIFPWKIYQNDPCWVPPLIPERTKVINPSPGVFFERGEADFFIAYRGGKPVGTICAGEDPPSNQKRGTRHCLFGFLEVVDDFQVFQALIRRVETWGGNRGLTALYGPWNLDYEDSYGVLVEGWDRPPALMCGHTPPYYREFIERAGFLPGRPENIALEISLEESDQFARLQRLADRLQTQGRITIRSADFQNWDSEIDRLHGLLNHALAHLEDSIGWRRDNLESMLAPFRRIADPEMVLFAEVGGETVGFLPGVPNLNETLIHANGLRFPWDYLRLLWAVKRHPARGMTVKSVLVLPAYWNTGVAVMLFAELLQRARQRGYRWADLSITSADNPTSVLTAEKLGAKIYKRWQVYTRKIPQERICLSGDERDFGL